MPFLQMLQAGQDRAHARKLETQQQASQADYFKYLNSPENAGQPSAPQALGAPPPQGQMPPQASPPQSGAPAPQFNADGVNDPRALAFLASLNAPQGGAPQGGAPQGGAPQGGQPPMPQGQPPMPQGQPPMPQPKPDPSLSATAQGGAPDAMAEATQNLRAAARSLKMQNPNADDYTLSLALQHYVNDMKGLSPLTKATMAAQTAVLTNQARMQQVQTRVQGMIDAAQARGASAKEVEALRIQGLEEVAEINGGFRVQQQAMRDETSSKDTATRAGATVKAATINAGARRYGAREAAETGRYRVDNKPNTAGDKQAATLAQIGARAAATYLNSHPSAKQAEIDAYADREVERARQQFGSGGGGGGVGGGGGSAPSAAPKAPPVGTITQGHKFKGGDPSKRKNWVKV